MTNPKAEAAWEQFVANMSAVEAFVMTPFDWWEASRRRCLTSRDADIQAAVADDSGNEHCDCMFDAETGVQFKSCGWHEKLIDLAVAAERERCAGMAERALKAARELVAKQAEDEGLWFIAETSPEAYLQQELRRLHRVVEGDEK